MTEAEWWAETDPRKLIDWLCFDASVTERKLRLFLVARCEPHCRFIGDPGILAALDVAEAFADGRVDAAALATANATALRDHHTRYYSGPEALPAEDTSAEARFPRQICLLHDIFGPLPFRDVAVAPAWRTSDVMALARGIYEEKAFDRMPILADALQDAGCDNDEVLGHCRAAQWEHVRGCWVIDLLLGKPWREERP